MGPLIREPIARETDLQGKRNELAWVIADRGGPRDVVQEIELMYA
jgi:hypothetical protein